MSRRQNKQGNDFLDKARSVLASILAVIKSIPSRLSNIPKPSKLPGLPKPGKTGKSGRGKSSREPERTRRTSILPDSDKYSSQGGKRRPSSGSRPSGSKSRRKRRKKNALERKLGVRLSPFGYGVITVGLILIVLILGLLLKGIFSLFGHSEKAAEATTVAITTEEPEPEPLTVTISAIGDCVIGQDAGYDYEANFDSYFDEFGADYFLTNVKNVLGSDDLTIANLDCALTDIAEHEDKNYCFRGKAAYASILSGGSVDAVNLANSHTRDYGEQGFTDTKANLDNVGVSHFGNDEIVVRDVNGIQVGLIGIYELEQHLQVEQQVKDSIAQAKNQGAQLVVVMFNWGIEKEEEPDENQTALAHLAIDEGADLVLGSHPHVLQGIENYNGKNIVYSLANFCHGGNNAPEYTDTMIFQQKFTFTEDGLQADNVINIIPCSITSNDNYNSFQPMPADTDRSDSIFSKLSQLSNKLGNTLDFSSQTMLTSDYLGAASTPDNTGDVMTTDPNNQTNQTDPYNQTNQTNQTDSNNQTNQYDQNNSSDTDNAVPSTDQYGNETGPVSATEIKSEQPTTATTEETAMPSDPNVSTEGSGYATTEAEETIIQ